jgi:hypothetical protein
MAKRRTIRADRVIVKSLMIEDAKGRMRVHLDTNPDDTPNLRFFDEEGHTRLDVFLQKDGQPTINVNSPKGMCRVALGLTSEGSAFMQFLDATQRPINAVVFDEKGTLKPLRKRSKP